MKQKSARIFRILFSCLIFSALFNCAQIIFAERLPVKFYTSADGLGSSFVDSIFKDSRGFMWFSTRDGLSRFDGARFEYFGEKEGLPSAGLINMELALFQSRTAVFMMTIIASFVMAKLIR